MPGPWFRAKPTPVTTRTVNNVSEFDTAVAASASAVPGDCIIMNQGTYTMERTVSKVGLQVIANGHVIIDGEVTMAGADQWWIGIEFTRPSTVLAGGVGNSIQANRVSIINCWLHSYLDPDFGGACALLIPAGRNDALVYGSVINDTRHVIYIQNGTTTKNWFAHNYIGDVQINHDPGNAYIVHDYSASDAINPRNFDFRQNIFANGRFLTGADGNAEIVHSVNLEDNRWFRSGIIQWNKPCETTIKNNKFYESILEFGQGNPGTKILDLIRVHGQGEFTFTYTNPTTYQGNLVYKPNDANVVTLDLRSDRYGSAGHDPGVALLRTQDITDSNTYFGYFRANVNANNTTQNNITDIATWQAATLSRGAQWDTGSQQSVAGGFPPNNYTIWDNDYNPDRGMISVFGYQGNVTVTLSRPGDIYEIHNQWGVPAYSGGTSYVITQNPFFGIIKYQGGAMAQFARPSADTNNPGSYTDQAGGSTNIFTTIDETVASDGDYIKSPAAPSSSVYVTKLSTVTDPASSVGHVLRVRYAKDAVGGGNIQVVAQLRQGYTNEGAQGTLIATRTFNSITDTFTTDAYTLSGPETDAITDYSSLYVRIVSTQS